MLTRIAFALLVIVGGGSTAAELSAQNLWKKARAPRSLISDLRAANVGDILTISVDETHSVVNEDKIDRTNQSSLAARLEEYSLSESTFKTNILPKIDVRQARSMVGEAKQERDSAVRASIAVIVIDVQPNGNLVVASSRVVQVDDETKTLKISGIVRPLDISKDNSVSSMQVADARISINGEGGNTQTVTRGPIASVFQTLWWAAWPF